MSENLDRPRPSFWATFALAGLYFARRAVARSAVGSYGSGDARSGRADVAATEQDRGRRADTPSSVPPRGWKDILWRTLSEFSDDRVLSLAASSTFYGLLAIFPAVAALVSIYGFFADPASVSSQLSSMSGVMPGGATQIIGDQMKRVAAQDSSTLGLSFFIGLAIALWSASAGLKALFDALNVVYDEKEERGFVKLSALALLFTLGAIVFLLIALGAVVVLPIVLNFVGFGRTAETVMKIVRWPALLVVVALALAVLYRYGPSRTKAKWRWITWGSATASVLWVIGSVLFSWYVENFGSYNKTYGSLGAAIGFMTWMWLSITIVLLGAELNSEIEHQTVEDTTAGGKKPPGRRGATVADTVGSSTG